MSGQDDFEGTFHAWKSHKLPLKLPHPAGALELCLPESLAYTQAIILSEGSQATGNLLNIFW